MMEGIYIDANLIVLLVVGWTGRNLISKHRRTRQFTSEDFDRLDRIVERQRQIFVTPNTLTEASNLLAQHREPERTRLHQTLGSMISRSNERLVNSRTATEQPEFLRLGLTDAALISVVSSKTPLLTVDFDLYHTILRKNVDAAINFNFNRYQ